MLSEISAACRSARPSWPRNPACRSARAPRAGWSRGASPSCARAARAAGGQPTATWSASAAGCAGGFAATPRMGRKLSASRVPATAMPANAMSATPMPCVNACAPSRAAPPIRSAGPYRRRRTRCLSPSAPPTQTAHQGRPGPPAQVRPGPIPPGRGNRPPNKAFRPAMQRGRYLVRRSCRDIRPYRDRVRGAGVKEVARNDRAETEGAAMTTSGPASRRTAALAPVRSGVP